MHSFSCLALGLPVVLVVFEFAVVEFAHQPFYNNRYHRLLWPMRLPPLTSASSSPRLSERDRVESLKEITGRLWPLFAILREAGQHQRIKVLWNRKLSS